MLTIIGAIVLVFLFFCMPIAVVIGSAGFLLAGPVGAVIGAGVGLLFDAAVQS
jgi:hypothetical protein